MQATFKFLSILAFVFLSSCSPTSRTLQPGRLQFIPYTAEKYEAASKEGVALLKSRLDAAGKFVEIGIMKVDGDVALEIVIEAAAARGADAIVQEKNNFTLIRYTERSEKRDVRKL